MRIIQIPTENEMSTCLQNLEGISLFWFTYTLCLQQVACLEIGDDVGLLPTGSLTNHRLEANRSDWPK